MSLLAPVVVLGVVAGLEGAYGRFGWSWIAGPVAALVVVALDRAARKPAEPAPVHRRDPAPVD